MHGPELEQPIAGRFGDPLLVGSAGALPLHHLGTVVSFLLGDVQEEPVEHALDGHTLALLHESPSLIKALVLLPLYQALTFLPGGSRHVQGLAGHVVGDNGAALDGGVVHLLESEQLALVVRVVGAIPEDALQGDGLVALAVSLDPVVLVESLDGGLHDGEQLVLALLAGPQPDLLALLVKHEGRDAVDNLEVVLTESDLLDHEELGIVLGVGLAAHNP